MPTGFVSLRVKLNTGKTLVLEVALDQPLRALLPLVEALEGAAPGTMRLTQGGRALLDCACNPRELNLHNGTTLEAQPHVLGGEQGALPDAQLQHVIYYYCHHHHIVLFLHTPILSQAWTGSVSGLRALPRSR